MNWFQKELLALKYGVGRYLEYRKSNTDYLHWLYTESARLSLFKHKHFGEDCFIIGNGPSLNKMDLTLLNDYYTFGMNKIFLIFKRVNLQLDYYVSVNSLVLEQSKEVIESHKTPSFVNYHVAQGLNYNNLDHIFKMYTSKPWSFYTHLDSGICEGYTVTYVAMQIAFFMGFKRVFLVGVDHNFQQTGDPNSKQKMEGEDPNHFDPNYFGGKEWHLADMEASEVSFTMAKRIFRDTNREILDATVDGKLQVFPKISYEEAIKIAKKKK